MNAATITVMAFVASVSRWTSASPSISLGTPSVITYLSSKCSSSPPPSPMRLSRRADKVGLYVLDNYCKKTTILVLICEGHYIQNAYNHKNKNLCFIHSRSQKFGTIIDCFSSRNAFPTMTCRLSYSFD